MLAETGATREASEGFIDLLSLSREADIVLLFKEHGPADPGQRPDRCRGRRGGDRIGLWWWWSSPSGRLHRGGAIAEARTQVLAECERELARADDRRH